MVGGGLQEGGFEFQILHCHILQKGISEIVYSFHALAWKWKGESNERGERPRKEKASRIKNWSIKNLWRLHTAAQRHPYAFKWGHTTTDKSDFWTLPTLIIPEQTQPIQSLGYVKKLCALGCVKLFKPLVWKCNFAESVNRLDWYIWHWRPPS